MKWYREFDIVMPHDLKSICESFIKKNKPEPYYTYYSVEDSNMWVIPPLGPKRERLYAAETEQLSGVRKLVTDTTGLNLEHDSPFMAIWQFDEAFPHCPVHIDDGAEHTGSVVTSISGDFKLHLHANDSLDSPIVESVNVPANKVIALNNTVFPHSVEGIGDLIVFGVDNHMNAEEYFKDV